MAEGIRSPKILDPKSSHPDYQNSLAFSYHSCYNDCMEPNLELLPETPVKAKRLLADMLRKYADTGTVLTSDNRKVTRAEYLAEMVWEGITTGKVSFLEGKSLAIGKFDEWQELVRFLATHTDGPVTAAIQQNNVNLVKVYLGVDMDKI